MVGAAGGALVGRFVEHTVSNGLGEKPGDALPPGSAGILAIYDRARTDLVTATLVSAVRTSIAEIGLPGFTHAG